MFQRIHRAARPVRWSRATLAALFLALAAGSASSQFTTTYFIVNPSGSQEVPSNSSTAIGSGCFMLDPPSHRLLFHVSFSGLSSMETGAHIHGFAPPGMNAPALFSLPLGSPTSGSVTTTPAQEQGIQQGLAYVNVDTVNFPNGEIRGQFMLPPLVPPTSYCFGDGSGTACPCGNNSASSANAGCLHSFGTGGTLRANGIGSVGCDAVVLTAGDLPPTTVALFFQGTTEANAGAGTVFGDGLLCVGGSIVRLSTVAVSGGTASYPAPNQTSISVQGGITSGGLRTYQVWYRNIASFCTPEGFNLTNGLSLLWYP